MDVYASLPFKVRGIGAFYSREGRQVVAKYADGEWTDIGVEDGINGGYVRANGDLVLVAGENVTCNDYYYKASQEFHLVVGLFEPYLLQNVLIECLKLTQSIPDVKISRTVTDKATILSDEGIGANSLMWFKIVFVYSYDYVTNNCDVPL